MPTLTRVIHHQSRHSPADSPHLGVVNVERWCVVCGHTQGNSGGVPMQSRVTGPMREDPRSAIGSVSSAKDLADGSRQRAVRLLPTRWSFAAFRVRVTAEVT